MKNASFFWIVPALIALATPLFAQKKPIEMEDIHRWKSIEKQAITTDGQWVAYQTRSVSEGDAELHLWHAADQKTRSFQRAENPQFSENGQWLVFTIKPALDTVRALKRKKTKADDLPKDSLGIYQLATGRLDKVARVKSFTLPEHWSGWLLIQLEPAPKEKEKKEAPKDTTAVGAQDTLKKAPEKKFKPKPENADNGAQLLVWRLGGQVDTLPFVTEYQLALRAPALLFTSTGIGEVPRWQSKKELAQAGVFYHSLPDGGLRPLWRGKAKYKQLAINESGQKTAFLLDTDTTKAVIRPWQLAFADINNSDSAAVVAAPDQGWLPEQPAAALRQGRWILSEHSRPVFDKKGNQLYFGIAPPPVVADTTLLPEEVAKVEVWASASPFLYTVQKNRLKAEQTRAWPAVCLLDQQKKLVSLADAARPELRAIFQKDRASAFALGIDEEPYMAASQYLGRMGKDLYALEIATGRKQRFASNVLGTAGFSPEGKHAFWWSPTDTAWYYQPIDQTGASIRLSSNAIGTFWNEEDDVPDLPDPYGIAAWFNGDKSVLVYDRYDIWQFDLLARTAPRRLTNGRPDKTTYRYVRLDPDQLTLSPNDKILLHSTHQVSKKEGYAWLDLSTGTISPWMNGDYSLTRSPQKAKKAEVLVYTQQNFATFPDLLYSAYPKGQSVRISDVNPQQAEYAWPNIEMVQWISLAGDTLSGLLIKPADFDGKRLYPMIVNFYEKLSDGLHQHRAPSFGRSQISHTQYASRGYVVFMPDIPYRTGFPGESAYDAIVSGVTAMIQRGGIDARRVALQGHSWGGYQAMYLLTRTRLFKCAEAGAAVGNMTSAYGGIRWESGVSRHFQYEHQQSRIGGSLWEKPMHYLENSPLFALDKVETPVLLLHNDKDGAVPFEQGIELFTGLRRLGKPAWLLNYNDEPHWPVKLPNRIDFQKRMQQFFDHYLLGEPMPRWMQKGIAPIEKDLKE